MTHKFIVDEADQTASSVSENLTMQAESPAVSQRKRNSLTPNCMDCQKVQRHVEGHPDLLKKLSEKKLSITNKKGDVCLFSPEVVQIVQIFIDLGKDVRTARKDEIIAMATTVLHTKVVGSETEVSATPAESPVTAAELQEEVDLTPPLTVNQSSGDEGKEAAPSEPTPAPVSQVGVSEDGIVPVSQEVAAADQVAGDHEKDHDAGAEETPLPAMLDSNATPVSTSAPVESAPTLASKNPEDDAGPVPDPQSAVASDQVDPLTDGLKAGDGEQDGDVESEQIPPPSKPDSTTVPAPEIGATQIEILYGYDKGIYTVHRAALLFPMITGQPYEELKQAIENDGQMEPCVMDGNVFLDGRNRVLILNELQIAPKIIQFSDLKSNLTPEAWVYSKNLHRRHLTDDQRLALMVMYQASSKEESARRKAASGNSEFPQVPAEIEPKPKVGRRPGARSDAEKLAKDAKVSRYVGEQLVKLQKESPELAIAVAKAEITLKQAMQRHKQDQSAKKAKADYPPQVDLITKAVDRAKKSLLKQVSQFDAKDQLDYWKRIAEFAMDQVETLEPKV